MSQGAFTFGDALRRTGANRGQLSHWTRLGIITPNVREARGTGDPRLYDAVNLLQVAVAVELAAYRIPAPVIRWVIQGAPRRDGLPPSPLFDALEHRYPLLVLHDPKRRFAWTGTREAYADLHRRRGSSTSTPATADAPSEFRASELLIELEGIRARLGLSLPPLAGAEGPEGGRVWLFADEEEMRQQPRSSRSTRRR